ncbi:MAG: hypothetical protein ACOY3Y_07320 [Acidobacteriota bacterium]
MRARALVLALTAAAITTSETWGETSASLSVGARVVPVVAVQTASLEIDSTLELDSAAGPSLETRAVRGLKATHNASVQRAERQAINAACDGAGVTGSPAEGRVVCRPHVLVTIASL